MNPDLTHFPGYSSLPTSPVPTSPGWEKWRDPVEGAFTIDVPTGWQVAGGLRRPMPADPRVVMALLSPDRTVQIFIGDDRIPTFVEPEGFLMLPPPEGSWYAPGMMVMRFRGGEQYAKEYGQHFFAEITGRPATLSFSQPDPASEMQVPRHLLLPGAIVSAGLAQFSIFSPQGPGVGLVSAVLARNPAPMGAGGLWHVILINRVVVSDPAATLPAVNTLRHMLGSFTYGQQSTPAAAGRPLAAPPAHPMASTPAGPGSDPSAIWREVQQAGIDAMNRVNAHAQEVYAKANTAWDDYIKS